MIINRFPKDSKLAAKWNDAIGIRSGNFQGLVCVNHFEDECLKNVRNRKALKPNSTPTIFEIKEKQQNSVTDDIGEGCSNTDVQSIQSAASLEVNNHCDDFMCTTTLIQNIESADFVLGK